MKNSGLYRLAQAIKQRRREIGLSATDLAQRANVSKGFISKVENFRTVPSLPVLIKIAVALNTTVSEITADVEQEQSTDYILVRRQEQQIIEKETSSGFSYRSLMMNTLGELFFEASIVTIEPGATRNTVTSDGFEFLLLLGGSITYILGGQELQLRKGDVLFFDGRIPHVPQNVGNKTAELLAVYLIGQETKG
jgi:transcriptional regulator with XRE-family HTH domain